MMNHHNEYGFEDPEGSEFIYPIRNMMDRNTRKKVNKLSTAKEQRNPRIRHDEPMIGEAFSYQPSRHERKWINQSLGGFFEQHWFDDILRLIKGGKEANVYQCLANPSVVGLEHPYLAAKVYRPRRFRNLKNDQLYREGRNHLDGDGNLITDDGMLHAMAKRTEYGNELLHASWIEHEVKTLQLLASVGADVPQVLTSGNNAVIMSYIGDDTSAAPILHSIALSCREASKLFDRVIQNIDLMLSIGRVHGDLSAYNILYWQGEIYLIDFPQTIDPEINRNAYWIFSRDVVKICDYFKRQGVKSDAQKIASGLWKKHRLKVIPDIHPGMLDFENEGDMSYWKHWSETP